ncbi:ABC transporter ATP-binding protein [Pseudorhodoplanes sp.]|uniref:ABC transporter ATP-binding protein n=1 Tax=Pseudorhodoplanes sp. TaxID=1934341 RepID=UPI003D1216CC
MDPVLSVRNLKTYFFTQDGVTRSVDGLSFDVFPGETVAIVGESGCGKSVTALSILRLLPERIARTVGGEVFFEDENILSIDEAEMREIRGNRISMIFQEPMTSLNPVLTVGEQIAEAVRIHDRSDKKAAVQKAVEMMRLVKIPDAERRFRDYPHQFSGGMRQRVMIAMALACGPQVLIADEPTTALDVTIQAQILQLILELKSRTGAAVVLITHDLGVVAETCQRVIVMYAGKKVEEGDVYELFDRPAHPYTRGLLGSMPSLHESKHRERLCEVGGVVPSLREKISGCAFAARCGWVTDRCRVEEPPLVPVSVKHISACHRAREVQGMADRVDENAYG